ncbi:MAG: hypothetical protein NT062_00415, partial [Proteobacteria bacterium]|nr:hypothetical protein [Pseudomonadota bacterium]
FSLDLDDDKLSCLERDAAVTQLRTLGDPRAIPALERALEKRGKYGALRGRPVNGCLADNARTAITYLKGLAKTP